MTATLPRRHAAPRRRDFPIGAPAPQGRGGLRLALRCVYARGGLVDYWIVNLRESVLEVYRKVYRKLVRAARAPRGWRYRHVGRFGPKAVVSPMGAPRARVRVADLLP